MPGFTRNQVLREILEIGLIPVFYYRETETAWNVVRACFEGGAKLVEFTNRGARAISVFQKLAYRRDEELPRLILGAGTILDPITVTAYIDAGADYIVGPTFNPQVAKACNRRRVLYIPGCFTPTEISEAEGMGVEIIKLFPGSVATPRFVKAVMGPMPNTLFMPSGGVKADRDEIAEWFGAGAVALNLGSDLVRKELVEAGDYEGIRERVRQCIGWIQEARE
jgi:2-dehydro-3-deoxyphosphogluconate aldolase/(4S)-4-hydroxy-2-oxoglutarate aldolase